jgi:hypothetical protein
MSDATITISEMIGKTPVLITQDTEEIIFSFSDGTKGVFYHFQDCCESVYVEDVTGDWSDLIGHPILVAEERSEENPNAEESGTWTFYTFRGVGGSVDVRWNGESNGCYSEGVDFEMMQRDEEDRG